MDKAAVLAIGSVDIECVEKSPHGNASRMSARVTFDAFVYVELAIQMLAKGGRCDEELRNDMLPATALE